MAVFALRMPARVGPAVPSENLYGTLFKYEGWNRRYNQFTTRLEINTLTRAATLAEPGGPGDLEWSLLSEPAAATPCLIELHQEASSLQTNHV